MKISAVFVVFLGWLSCSTFAFSLAGLLLKPIKRSIGDVVSKWIFKEKCMGELGCFNNGAPFFDILERPLSLVPSDRESINTRFLLHTRSNPHSPQNFSNFERNAEVLLRSTFLPESRIKFIVPGFISSWAPEWAEPLIQAILNVENVNVFVINWTGGDGPLYEQAVANTRVVGAELALFIEFLQNSTGIRPEDVHIIGHSLGSHIAGYAGKKIRNIGRITGLDPAGPYFEKVDPEVRLSHTDAILVDVIHTNAASTRFQGFGTTESIGDLDFFPNGGALQPGCQNLGYAILDFLKHPSLKGEGIYPLMCNHHRAIDLFISSVAATTCDMMGIRCDTWEDFLTGTCGNCSSSPEKCVMMGYHADEMWTETGSQPGNFYLNTTSSEPFCYQI